VRAFIVGNRTISGIAGGIIDQFPIHIYRFWLGVAWITQSLSAVLHVRPFRRTAVLTPSQIRGHILWAVDINKLDHTNPGLPELTVTATSANCVVSRDNVLHGSCSSLVIVFCECPW
jgi:hypothetical protein